jgi:hypothetical protein
MPSPGGTAEITRHARKCLPDDITVFIGRHGTWQTPFGRPYGTCCFIREEPTSIRQLDFESQPRRGHPHTRTRLPSLHPARDGRRLPNRAGHPADIGQRTGVFFQRSKLYGLCNLTRPALLSFQTNALHGILDFGFWCSFPITTTSHKATTGDKGRFLRDLPPTE